jgi:hypothetical protein
MVNVTVDNPPISVQLADNESFSPNNGEVLKVNITLSQPADDGEAALEINGTTVMAVVNVDDSSGVSTDATATAETVLTDSDTVTVNTNDGTTTPRGGAHIGGFDVS